MQTHAAMQVQIVGSACLLIDFSLYGKLLTYTLGPYLIIAILALPSTCAILKKHAKKDALVDLLWHSSLFLFFLIYPSVSQIVLSTFSCDNLSFDGKFLSSDYRINCETTEWEAYRNFAIFAVLLWPCGFPLGCWLFLHWQAKLA